MMNIKINGKKLGKNTPIFLIAEAGINHNGELEIAKKLIDIASKAEVDAVKFQTFITENLMLKSTSKAEYQMKNTDDKETFYEMAKKYEFNFHDFEILKKYTKEKDLIFLSTPFDNESVEMLDKLDISAYKVGSGDMDNFPLLKLICSKRKPILLSTGMATLDDVKKSVDFIRSNAIKDLVIFQCTTNYPTSLEEVNLNIIDTYKKEFPDLIIGFSDHSLGFEASIGAAAKGTKVIEKHFTLDKNMEGPDHKASLNPEDLIKWVNAIRNIERVLGTNVKSPSKSEIEIAKIAKKSVVSAQKLEFGDILNENNIAIKRPGTGIPPTEYYKILGKTVKKKIPKDSVIHWEDININEK